METYTMQDWKRDGSLRPAIGQEVSDEVLDELINCLPPTYWAGGWFQTGEPYTHDTDTGRALYMTFFGNEYRGLKPNIGVYGIE